MKLEVPLIAPIPVGHRISVYNVERLEHPLFSNTRWVESDTKIVADHDTRIVYASRRVPALSLRYGEIDLEGSFRIGTETRGVVAACALLTDHGDGIAMKTLLELEPDRDAYR